MDELSREFITAASKMEVEHCSDIEELKKVTVSLIDLVQKQKGMIQRLVKEKVFADGPNFDL